MANRILNAGGLDGLTDWTGATSVDEEIVGGPGRAVILAAGGTLRSSSTAVTPGQALEAFGHVGGQGAALAVEFLAAGGALVDTVAIPQIAPGAPPARRGLPHTFAAFRGRPVAPAGSASARLKATAAAGAVSLLKPFLETQPWERDSAWNVGPHTNPDLNRQTWPTKLRLPDAGSYSVEPISTRRAFAGDVGVPITRRLTITPRYRLSAEIRVSIEEYDRLEAFFLASVEPFFFVRYDTQQVCRAYWLEDGEPKLSGSRLVNRSARIGLLLEVA